MNPRILRRLVFILLTLLAAPAIGREPNWSGTIIATGNERTKIQSTDIRKRPYRPLHFYGNTIRRMHHRGQPVPMPRDFFQGFSALLGR